VPPDPSTALRDHGIYVTAQRLAVMRAVDAQPHATADVIVRTVRDEIGTVSRQAVYDTLNTLSTLGVLRRFQPMGSPARFESRAGDNHHHLMCRSCGRVEDVDCAVGARPCLTASDDHGFEIDEAEVIYWGTCPDCRAGATPPADTGTPSQDSTSQDTSSQDTTTDTLQGEP
jgi:Fur family ferric uptake transcriptional regulator